jgi:hypothetical protein
MRTNPHAACVGAIRGTKREKITIGGGHQT